MISKSLLVLAASCLFFHPCNAFAPIRNKIHPNNGVRTVVTSTPMAMKELRMVENSLLDMGAASTWASTTSTMILAETEPWVQPLAAVLGPFLNIFSFAMVRSNHDMIIFSMNPTVLFLT